MELSEHSWVSNHSGPSGERLQVAFKRKISFIYQPDQVEIICMLNGSDPLVDRMCKTSNVNRADDNIRYYSLFTWPHELIFQLCNVLREVLVQTVCVVDVVV